MCAVESPRTRSSSHVAVPPSPSSRPRCLLATTDTKTGQNFDERFQTRAFDIPNTTAYTVYRLNITALHGADLLQLAEAVPLRRQPSAAAERADVHRGPRRGCLPLGHAAGQLIPYRRQPLTGLGLLE